MTDAERWHAIYEITSNVLALIGEREKLESAVSNRDPEELNMVLHHASPHFRDTLPVHHFISSLVPMSTPDYIDRYTAHIDAEIKRKQKQLHLLTR